MTYLLGIDVGTTATKALLVTPEGTVVAAAANQYALSTPRPLWVEQDPEAWWAASARSIREVLACSGAVASDIAAVGLTGQMHGLVLLDGAGAVIRPAVLWNDQRTGAECDEITRRVGAARLIDLTGSAVLPGFIAPKLLWVRRNEPDAYRRTCAVLLPKDYVRLRLTGVMVSDVTDASGTSMFDVARRRWSDDMVAVLEIPRAWLPEVTESAAVSARVSRTAARETGLLEGTPVASGAGDQAAQAVGAGTVEDGAVSITIGTSGVVFAASTSYRIDPLGRLHAFCHASPGLWHLMGVVLSAGGSLRWYRDALCADVKREAALAGEDPYDRLLEAAARVPAGADGLYFLPYLTGERTPHADPHARGVFLGLRLGHERPHLTRAVVEGVTYALRDSLELMRETGLVVRTVRASGGGARSRFWLQVVADVCGVEVVTLEVAEGAAFGAALIAGVGAGVFPDVETATRSTVRETGRRAPGPDREAYGRYYPCFRSLYPALSGRFRALDESQGDLP